MSDFELIFLTRPGCRLCDEARPIVEAAASRAGVLVEELDVDSSPALSDSFGTRIPVLLGPSDEVIAEGVIDDHRRLWKMIRRSARGGR